MRPRSMRGWVVGLAIAATGLLAVGSAWAGIWPSRTIDVARLLGGTYRIYNDRGGHAGEPILAAPGSREALSVDRWLRAHPSGWSTSFATYAPSRYVRGDRFTLNVFSKLAILNYRTDTAPDRWNQVTRVIDPGDRPDSCDAAPAPAR